MNNSRAKVLQSVTPIAHGKSDDLTTLAAIKVRVTVADLKNADLEIVHLSSTAGGRDPFATSRPVMWACVGRTWCHCVGKMGDPEVQRVYSHFS